MRSFDLSTPAPALPLPLEAVEPLLGVGVDALAKVSALLASLPKLVVMLFTDAAMLVRSFASCFWLLRHTCRPAPQRHRIEERHRSVSDPHCSDSDAAPLPQVVFACALAYLCHRLDGRAQHGALQMTHGRGHRRWGVNLAGPGRSVDRSIASVLAAASPRTQV